MTSQKRVNHSKISKSGVPGKGREEWVERQET